MPLSSAAVSSSPDVVMLMSSEAGAEAEGNVDVTQTNDSLHDSVGGAQAEALSFYLSRGEQSDCSRGASPGLEGEGPTPDCLTLHQDSRDRRRSETETPRPQSGQESRVPLGRTKVITLYSSEDILSCYRLLQKKRKGKYRKVCVCVCMCICVHSKLQTFNFHCCTENVCCWSKYVTAGPV